MTCFVISHNLQVHAQAVPSLAPAVLAETLQASSQCIKTAEPLDHPHWLVRIDSELDAIALAVELPRAWRAMRRMLGHGADHELLALGGRKDNPAMPGSPLQEGYWGVDVVETYDGGAFLKTINWDGLKQGRPVDGVFEVWG